MTDTAGFATTTMKLSIGSTDDVKLQVTAQYNPSQLDLQRTVGWERGNNKRDNRPDHRRSTPADNDLEYKGGEGRSLTLELLFDGFETNTCVEPLIEALDQMATLRHEADSNDPDPRPHQCVIVWGTEGIRPLVCVIESLGVKYSVFDPNGRPLRATATVKVKEASVSAFDRPSAFGANRRHTTVGAYTHDRPKGIPRSLPPVRSKK